MTEHELYRRETGDYVCRLCGKVFKSDEDISGTCTPAFAWNVGPIDTK